MSCVTTTLVTGRWRRVCRISSLITSRHDRVEAGRRLVVEHDLRVEGQRPGQADPLPHAARQLGRLLRLDAVGGRPTSCSRWRDPLARSPARRAAAAPAGRRRRCRRPSGCRTGPPPGTGSRTAAAAGSARARAGRRASGRRSGPRPRVGRSRPMISFSSTVLPQPLSPMTTSVWPRGDPQVDVAQHALRAELHRHGRSSSMIGPAREPGWRRSLVGS